MEGGDECHEEVEEKPGAARLPSLVRPAGGATTAGAQLKGASLARMIGRTVLPFSVDDSSGHVVLNLRVDGRTFNTFCDAS